MTPEEQATAIVDKFKMATKDSEYTVIEGDDADQLILDIAAALREREHGERGKTLEDVRLRGWHAIHGDWCRAQKEPRP